MSGSVTRRNALRGFVAAGAIAQTAGGLTVSGALAAEQRRQCPEVPMRLSRTIERELKDGEMLSVLRRWQVEFEPSGRGHAIFGSQQEVRVDVPAPLEALAQIERERSTAGMFPILLDEQGMILAAGESHTSADLQEVLSRAQDMLEVDAMEAGEADAVNEMLRRLGQASSRLIETLPSDLFFPRQASFQTTRELALSGEVTGEFAVHYEAQVTPATGLLERAERKVMTRLGSDARLSREIWTLESLV